MLLWSSKNGPQGYAFNASIIATLGDVVANIATARPKKVSDAGKAIISLIHGKNKLNMLLLFLLMEMDWIVIELGRHYVWVVFLL